MLNKKILIFSILFMVFVGITTVSATDDNVLSTDNQITTTDTVSVDIDTDNVVKEDNKIITENNKNVKKDVTAFEDTNDKSLKGADNILVLTSDNYKTYCDYEETDEGYIYINNLKTKKIPNSWSGTIYFNDTLNSKLCGINIGLRNNSIVTANPNITFTNVIFNSMYQMPAVRNVTLTNISIKIDNGILNTGILYEWMFSRPAILKNPSSKDFVFDNVTLNCQIDKDSFSSMPMDAVRIETGLTIKNCHFNITGYSSTVDWMEDSQNYGRNDFMAIYQTKFDDMMGYEENHEEITPEDLNTYIINNTFIFNSNDTIGSYPTLYGIHVNRENTTVSGNTIVFNAGEGWNYAIDAQANNVTITDNVISVSGINYTAGIGLENPRNNIIDNNIIYVNSSMDEHIYDGTSNEYCAYAIFLNDYGYQGGTLNPAVSRAYNNIISNNHIIGNAFNTYAIEEFGGKDNTIKDNLIELNANTAMGIGAISHNVTIINNNISINGTNVTGGTVDYLGAMTTGIFLARCGNNTVYNNNINSTKYGMYLKSEKNDLIENNTVLTDFDNAVYLQRTNNSIIRNNYLESQTLKGNNAVIDYEGTGNVIENNQPTGDTPKTNTTIICELDEEYNSNEDIMISGELLYGEDELPLVGEDVTITITFSDNTNITNTVTSDDEGFVCIFESSDLVIGDTTITIEYAGNANYNGASLECTTTIIEAEATLIETQVDLSIDSEYDFKYGKPIIYTVNVYYDGYNTVYEGNVTIYNGDVALTSIDLSQSTGGIMMLGDAGTYNLIAKYEGSQTYAESTSDEEEVVIYPCETTTTITAEKTQVNQGENVTFTVTVTDEFNKQVTNGTVLIEGEGTYGTIDLSTGNTLSVKLGEAGTYIISAIFNGTNNYVESTSQTPATVEVTSDETPKEYTLKVDTTEFTVGTNATIQASIYYGNEFTEEVAENINKGKVAFKVNGKTLKNAEGKVIYAKVINGTAKIENYLIPESWNKDAITIEAVYSGSTQCDALRSNKTEMTINNPQATITTEDVTTTVGGTITLKATVTDGNKVINTGKVVFKINGKSVKDANGKVIYAKIENNQVSVTYTLPESLKAKTYALTAVLVSSEYDRLEDTKTLTIN